MTKYQNAVKNIKTFNIGDKVRHVVNLDLFEKGSISRYSKNAFTIIDKIKHSYNLSDNKWYKYYHLLPIAEIVKMPEKDHLISRAYEPTLEQMKNVIHVKRKLKNEGVEIANITKSKTTRAQQKEFIEKNKRSMRIQKQVTNRFHY